MRISAKEPVTFISRKSTVLAFVTIKNGCKKLKRTDFKGHYRFKSSPKQSRAYLGPLLCEIEAGLVHKGDKLGVYQDQLQTGYNHSTQLGHAGI